MGVFGGLGDVVVICAKIVWCWQCFIAIVLVLQVLRRPTRLDLR